MPAGFRITFAGNIGTAQDFGTILSAAELPKEHRDIHWMIVGDGRMLPWVREQVQSRWLEKTVHLLGRHPLAAMPAFFAKANFMLASLKKEPIFALTIPAKVQSYLAGVGLTCPAEDSEALAKTVLKIYHMPPSEREQMARRAREYFENNRKEDGI